MSVDRAPDQCDVAVIGGGIVGLAVARELTRRHPRSTLAVIERERATGLHQTSHNSGVIHAGLYYPPGSLKARLCVDGARELYEYCEERGIAHERCGKLVVAIDESELAGLEEIERRGRANGVSGLRRLGAHEIERIEPHALGIAALHSPDTGIVDFTSVASALAADLRAEGATIATSCGVNGVGANERAITLHHAHGATAASAAIFCAGASSDRLAVMAGASPAPRIVPFRGAYLRLRPECRDLVSGLIYPVPDPALPFLGVHLTRRIDGEVLVGPTALLVGARDAYRLRRVSRSDLADTLSWPGTWRMARRFWRSGLTEIRHVTSRRAFVAAAARYIPGLETNDVQAGPTGVRAQALDRDGRLVDDFVFSHTERALHVRNAPSPAATSCLTIARHVADEAERALGLEPGSRRSIRPAQA